MIFYILIFNIIVLKSKNTKKKVKIIKNYLLDIINKYIFFFKTKHF